MGSCRSLTPGTSVTAVLIMAGLWAWILTILRPLALGRQQPLAAGFGDTAVWPATPQTYLLSQGIRLTRAVIGWAAKPLSVCKRGQFGAASQPIIGRLRTGSRSIIAIPILEASARRWSM